MGGWVLLPSLKCTDCTVSLKGAGWWEQAGTDCLPAPGTDSQPALSLVKEGCGGRWDFHLVIQLSPERDSLPFSHKEHIREMRPAVG